MGIVRGNLFHQIGAGFQVIEENLTAGVGGILSEQVAVMPYLKGHIRHRLVAGQVILQNPQGGPCPVGDGQHGIVLNGGVVGVNVDAVGGLVQNIPGGGGGFHDFDIGFFFNASHTGLAGVVGGDRGNELAVCVHVKGGVGQRYAGLLVYLHNGQADVPYIFPCNENIFGAIPFHRLYTGGLHITVRGRLFRDAIGAVG